MDINQALEVFGANASISLKELSKIWYRMWEHDLDEAINARSDNQRSTIEAQKKDRNQAMEVIELYVRCDDEVFLPIFDLRYEGKLEAGNPPMQKEEALAFMGVKEALSNAEIEVAIENKIHQVEEQLRTMPIEAAKNAYRICKEDIERAVYQLDCIHKRAKEQALRVLGLEEETSRQEAFHSYQSKRKELDSRYASASDDAEREQFRKASGELEIAWHVLFHRAELMF